MAEELDFSYFLGMNRFQKEANKFRRIDGAFVHY